MKKRKNRFLFILLFILLFPFILIELLFKGIGKGLKKIKLKRTSFGDKDFYASLSIEKVDIMDGVEFEKFLKRLFLYRGYSVEQTPRTGDFGADLILKKDGKTTVVQAKRYNGNVGAKALQEIYSAKAHYKSDFMMVVTNAHFTKQAEVMAFEQNIELIDREELISIIHEVQQELKEELIKEQGEEQIENLDYSDFNNFKYRI